MLSDQLYRNKTGLSLAFCLLFSLGCLIWKGNGIAQLIVSMDNAAVGVSSSLSDIGGWFSGVWHSIEDYEKMQAERDAYRAALGEAEVLRSQFEKLKDENELLRQSLGFKPDLPAEYQKAEVLAVRLSNIYKTIIIDKGTEDGIDTFMPVVAKAIYNYVDPKTGKPRKYFIHGLVGKVIAVDDSSAVVQPLVNAQFRAGVRLPKTRLWAMLEGNSERAMFPKLQYISSFVTLDKNKMNIPVVTSGKGGVFPPGILVGRIIDTGGGDAVQLSNQGFKTAYIEPFVKIEALDHVLVLKKQPDSWAANWPEDMIIVPGKAKMNKVVSPVIGAGELPGTDKYLANVPDILVAKEEAKQKKKKKAKKSGAKKVKKKKSKPKAEEAEDDDDEFADIYIEEDEGEG